jgi:WhiB family redox-sensing transcriptional regulator
VIDLSAEPWMRHGACRGLARADADRLFFPARGDSTAEAKAVCAACQVRAECLQYALEHNEKFGIWGGLSERERRRLRRARRAAAA